METAVERELTRQIEPAAPPSRQTTAEIAAQRSDHLRSPVGEETLLSRRSSSSGPIRCHSRGHLKAQQSIQAIEGHSPEQSVGQRNCRSQAPPEEVRYFSTHSETAGSMDYDNWRRSLCNDNNIHHRQFPAWADPSRSASGESEEEISYHRHDATPLGARQAVTPLNLVRRHTNRSSARAARVAHSVVAERVGAAAPARRG